MTAVKPENIFTEDSIDNRPDRRLYSFTLPIIPKAQARPRFTRKGYAYKSKSQLDCEHTLEAMLLPYKPALPLQGAISLTIKAYLPMPKSAGKKKQEAMLDGIIAHTHKPDIDNLVKNILDSMTRLAFWYDDRQITEIKASKAYAKAPCWEVRVTGLCG